MSKHYVHKRRETIQPSFPNNKLSSRPRKKKVTKQEWVEDDLTIYPRVPASAITTPYNQPNPTDNAPSFFTNSFQEIYGGLSPTSNDTDGDGLFDGPNVLASYSLDGKAHTGEGEVLGATYDCPYNIQGDTNGDGILDSGETWLETNPLNPDTDGDSANDGQEIFGFKLTWMKQESDGKIKSTNVTDVKASPVDVKNYWLDTRKTPNVWEMRDLDMDGISDYDETHYAEAYPFITGWANARQAEWELSPDDSPEFNAAQYLESQFNPFMKENVPPIILDMTVVTVEESHTEYGFVKIIDHFYADITLETFDPSPAYMNIEIGTEGYSIYTITGGHHTNSFVINQDHPSMFLYGYVVNLTTWDYTGHYSYLEIEVDGLFSGVIDFLEAIWNGLCGAFSAVADAVAAAMSFLWKMMMAFYMTILSPLFEAMNNTFNNFWAEFEVMVDELFLPHSPEKFVIDPEGTVDKFMNWFKLNSFMSSMLAIGLVIWVLEQGANFALPGLGTVIAFAAGTIWFVSLIKMLEFGTMKLETESGFVPAFTLTDSEMQERMSFLDNAGQLAVAFAIVAVENIMASQIALSSVAKSIFWSAASMILSIMAFSELGREPPGL